MSSESSSSTNRDNPNFAHEKQKNTDYINGLEYQVLQMRIKHPEKYIKAQSIGNSYMNCSYELKNGIDEEGDRVTSQLLLYQIRDYILSDEDLATSEIELLARVYGVNWRDKIDDLE